MRRQDGYTLIEIIIVLALIGTLMSLAAISLARSSTNAELRQLSRKVIAGLRYTRTRAILDKQDQVFLVDAEERTFKAADKNLVEMPKGVDITLTTATTEVVSDSVGGVRFFPDGGSTGGNIVLLVNEREYRVDVAWLTGEASLHRPE